MELPTFGKSGYKTVSKKECPSCAMEVDSDSKVCPVCGYEFTQTSPVLKWVVILIVILFLLYIIF